MFHKNPILDTGLFFFEAIVKARAQGRSWFSAMTSEQVQLPIPSMQTKDGEKLDGNAVQDLSAVEPISPTPSQYSTFRSSLQMNLYPDGIMVEEPLIASPVQLHPTDPIIPKSPPLSTVAKKSATSNGFPTTSPNGRLTDSSHQRAATTTMIPQLQKQQHQLANLDTSNSLNGLPNSLYKVDTFNSTSGSRNLNRTSTDRLERRSTHGPDLGDLAPEEQILLEQEIAARRAARRASRRRMEEEDDGRVLIGTRVAEGHRNYQLM